MVNIRQLSAIILVGVSVGIADVLIKKAASTGSFWAVFKNPLIITILLLYAAQLAFFVYVFRHQWKLGIAGNLQMVFYSLTVILSGLIVFGEKISLAQGIGIGLALIGVILMNL